MFRVAFTKPLTAPRPTFGATNSSALAEGRSRRHFLARPWYVTGVISKRRTCGSFGFSGASERVRWNSNACSFAAEIAAAMHCGWDDTCCQFLGQLHMSQ